MVIQLRIPIVSIVFTGVGKSGAAPLMSVAVLRNVFKQEGVNAWRVGLQKGGDERCLGLLRHKLKRRKQ